MKMTEMKLLFIIFVAAKIGHIKTQCIASVPTIRYVPSCPSDEESWRKAELQKNCQSLAEIQTCVQDSSKFKYHCLVNTFLNATLEVCAPIRFLTGYCADFNIQESKVTENYNIDCTKLRPACPPRYESTEIYKYQSCYKLKEKYIKIENSSELSDYSTLEVSTTSIYVHRQLETGAPTVALIGMGTALAIFVFISISYAVFKLRKRLISHQMSRYDTEDAGVMLIHCTDRVETNGERYDTDLTKGTDEELEEEEDFVSNKYFRLCPKDRTKLTEEEKLKNEAATELLVSSNEESTRNFLDNAKSADRFYEETKVFKKVKNIFMTNNAVILIGPPGFGKTQTAIHMMMTFKEEWIIRKVENYVELNYIECAKRTIVFIDNIFDGKSTEIAEWMEPLERLNKLIRSMDKNGTQLKKNEGGETKENKGEGEENEAEELNEENKGETIEKKGRKINENKEETKENKNEETIENTAGKTIERRGDPNKIKGGETTENKGEKRQENETEELNEDDKGGETIEKKGQKKEKKGEAKEYKGEVVKRENGEVKVIVTAKSGIIEEACELFNKRTIFWEDCIVNLSEEKYELKNNEKKRILLKQIEFANQKKGIRPPDLSDIFWERVTKSKAHIGFPLCAHLFAFEEAFRKKGEDFFSWPTQLVLIQIQDVVTNDKTNRIKTLLLLLLLAEIHNRNKDQESKYKPDIKNEKDCANFVKKTCRLGDYFQPLNFKNLQAVVSELTWSFIRETGENSYQFIHQSVFDAVETYIFRSFPIKSIVLLPLDVIQQQTNDKEGLHWLKDEHFRYLAKRFITEIKCGRSSHICECEILKRTEFIKIFHVAVANLDKRDLVDFFNRKSIAYPRLPILFWLGRSETTQLLKCLHSVIESARNDNLCAVEHIYYSLYGECTKSGTLKSLGSMKVDRIKKDVKDYIISFSDNMSNTVLHVVIQSTREDDFASKIVKQLIKDNVDINAKNRNWETPLMLAVKVTWPISRQLVIEELVKNHCEIKSKDRHQNSVFHYCVLEETDHDDMTCAKILDILLKTNERIDLSTENTKGLTALNLACKNTRNSRILSICTILAYDGPSEQEDSKKREKTQSAIHEKKKGGDPSDHVNKIDKDGKYPIFNAISCLTGENELVEMERLLRVCILLLYGADPTIISDDNYRSAIAYCKDKGYSDLDAIMESMFNSCKNDETSTDSLMIEALKKGLKRLSKTHATGDHTRITMKFSNKVQISEELKNLLSNAVQYLSKTQL